MIIPGCSERSIAAHIHWQPCCAWSRRGPTHLTGRDGACHGGRPFDADAGSSLTTCPTQFPTGCSAPPNRSCDASVAWWSYVTRKSPANIHAPRNEGCWRKRTRTCDITFGNLVRLLRHSSANMQQPSAKWLAAQMRGIGWSDQMSETVTVPAESTLIVDGRRVEYSQPTITFNSPPRPIDPLVPMTRVWRPNRSSPLRK